MADQTQFKHIKVNAGEDDDMVIYAGVHSDKQNEEFLEDAPSPEPASVSSSVTETSAEQYHETTLDDIRTSKMPTIQKVILIIATIAIIAFVVWYACFR